MIYIYIYIKLCPMTHQQTFAHLRLTLSDCLMLDHPLCSSSCHQSLAVQPCILQWAFQITIDLGYHFLWIYCLKQLFFTWHVFHILFNVIIIKTSKWYSYCKQSTVNVNFSPLIPDSVCLKLQNNLFSFKESDMSMTAKWPRFMSSPWLQ